MWKQLLGVAELGYVGFIGMLWLEELRFSGVGVYMTDTYNHKDVTAYFKEADYKLKQVSPSKLMQVCVCVAVGTTNKRQQCLRLLLLGRPLLMPWCE